MTSPKLPAHYDSDLPPEPLTEDTPPEPADLAGPPEPDDLAGHPEPEAVAPPAPPQPTAVQEAAPRQAPPPPAPAPALRAVPFPGPASPSLPSPVQTHPPGKPDARERQRAALAAEIHNPRGADRRAVILPGVVLLLLLVGGAFLVHVWAGAEEASRYTTAEVKTPHQERLERERALQELMPSGAPPELAELPPEPPPALEAAGEQTGIQPSTAAAPVAPSSPRRARPVHTSPSQPAAEVAEPLPEASTQPPRRSLATPMATSFSDAPTTSASPAPLQRGTFLPACLTAAADPAHPAPFTATISSDVKAGDTVSVPRGSTLVCTAQGVTGSRLTGSCDTINIPGRASLSFAGLVYGRDKRLGLPIVVTGGPGAGDDVQDTALTTAERVLGSVSPGGIGGELLQGAAGAGGRVARNTTRSSEPSARPVPKGTCFLVFVDQPF